MNILNDDPDLFNIWNEITNSNVMNRNDIDDDDAISKAILESLLLENFGDLNTPDISQQKPNLKRLTSQLGDSLAKTKNSLPTPPLSPPAHYKQTINEAISKLTKKSSSSKLKQSSHDNQTSQATRSSARLMSKRLNSRNFESDFEYNLKLTPKSVPQHQQLTAAPISVSPKDHVETNNKLNNNKSNLLVSTSRNYKRKRSCEEYDNDEDNYECTNSSSNNTSSLNSNENSLDFDEMQPLNKKQIVLSSRMNSIEYQQSDRCSKFTSKDSNKDAASRYRLKKINEKDHLFETRVNLEKENSDVKRRIDIVKAEINYLKNILVQMLLNKGYLDSSRLNGS